MKVTHIDHGDWTEDVFEPDDPQTGTGKANGGAGTAASSGAQPGTSGGAWPVLDSAALHGLAGNVVNTILPHTESDPVGLLLQFLVSFGNAVGRQPFYFIEGARQLSRALRAGRRPDGEGAQGYCSKPHPPDIRHR
jgi:hypothetical protein